MQNPGVSRVSVSELGLDGGRGGGKCPPRLGGAAGGDRVADLAQIVGQDAQANPALQASLAAVAAARQAEAALEQTDPTLDAGAEAVGPTKRRSMLKAASLRAERPWAGEGDGPDASRRCPT